MTLTIPLLLFAGFLVCAILAVVLLLGTGARDAMLLYKTSMVPSLHTPGWGHLIAYGLGIVFVLLANIGWWGGWIALAVWAVLKLA
jgi:hypothetical protein